MVKRKIGVLIVDDSAFIRKALKRMLMSDPIINVVGVARDGIEALEKVKHLKPDVVTLDIKMPLMDGLTTLEHLMKENPIPVLVVSSLTRDGGGVTLKALEAGAIDFIDKSSCHTIMDILDIADSLVQKVKVLAGVDLKKVLKIPREQLSPKAILTSTSAPSPAFIQPAHLVVIGASTGGPLALEAILTKLPGEYPGAILIVQHMPLGFTLSFAERLNDLCALRVKEAQEDDYILPGHVYIAPSGYHLKIKSSTKATHVILSKFPHDMLHRPSIDVLFESVGCEWKGKLLAVLLTGMGADGVQGIKAVKQRGGKVIAQDEVTCVVFGIPKAAQQSGLVDAMVPLDRISQRILRFK
jgi:two-component system chemotaxis response regulator CheB